MPIESDNAVVVPERTFPLWWVQNFSVSATNPNQPVTVSAQFVRVTERDEFGQCEKMAGSEVNYQLDDLFALAAQDQGVATLINTLISTIGGLAKSAGRID